MAKRSGLALTALYNNIGSLSGFSSKTSCFREKRSGNTDELNVGSMEMDRNNLLALVNNTSDLMWSVDRNYKLLASNSAFDKMVEYTSGRPIAKGSDMLAFGSTADGATSYKALYDRALAGEIFSFVEYAKLPRTYWSEISFYPIWSGDEVMGMACYAHDITERKIAEEKIVNTQRLYEFISQINQAITHTTDERSLFDKACNIAVDNGKFGLAWIAIPDLIGKKMNVTAHNRNAIAADIAALNDLELDDEGLTAKVMRNGEYYVINDLDHQPVNTGSYRYASKRGYRSLIVLPIMKSGSAIGTYNLLSTRADLFDEQEIRLLKEATGDISFALDVFEKEKNRKQMELKVAHSEVRLKQAQSIAHVGNWEFYFADIFVTWSEEACRIYGLSPDDNLHPQQMWRSFIHPEDEVYVAKAIRESEETFSNSAYHHRIIRRDGTVRYIFSQAYFEFNADGIPIGLYGVVHDETDAKEAENALARSETNLAQIIDLIPQCIFIKDYDGNYIFVNKAYALLYGHTPEQMIERPMTDMIPGVDRAQYLEEDREVISLGKPKVIPAHIINDHNGHERLLHLVKVPFTTAETNQRSVLGVMNDITEVKKAETERAKIVAQIIQRNNDLEQFSYIVSHNLRAPVANILGIVDILQTIGIDKEEGIMVVDLLASSTKNLDNVIKDINHILSLKHGVNELKVHVGFEDLLNEVKLSIQNMLDTEQVSIVSDFSEAGEMFTIKSYLYSIFIDLISNSIKYRQPGILPVIHICTRKAADSIQLRFSDNGIGIDLVKEGNNVFGLYKRFHTHVEGKGMGLYIVRSQVELLGGEITVASEISKGTEFCISF